MNEISGITNYSEKTARLTVLNSLIASKAQPGQFVIIKFSTDGERIPFSIIRTDRSSGTIDIIIHRADGLDEILGSLHEGDVLPDLLGPLGTPAKIEKEKTLIFCGDGNGFVPLLPLINASMVCGCKVHAIVSEISSKSGCMLSDINDACEHITVIEEESVPATLRKWMDEYHPDKVVMSGPTLLMKELASICREACIAADCVLNMLMIDGIGICGVCRVMVGGKQKQTCVDGPVFNAWEVDFDDIMNRQRSFV